MIEFEQNMPCDLIMGFSLDLLMDLVSLNIKQIKIDNTSVGVISNSNKYVFSLYFQSGSDCVVINKPHGIKIIDAKLLETVAWGSSSLRSGSVTQVLKFSHHYLVDYVMSVDPGKKSFIILKYNGTAIEVVEGGALGDIPVKMIRQVIQSSMNTNPVPSVELEHPSINIPFADTAVDFKRLKFFGNGEGKDKSPLYFDAVVNGRKYMLGQVENNANGLVDLKRTSILKRDDMPLTISVQGQKIDCNTRTASLIGKAVNVHEDYNDTQLYSLTGSDPVSETEICGELTNVKIKHVYNNVQLLINPIL
ncbi:MAG: hypothetical protein H8D23_39640, partial [Candidatus Brocadiales bacterium]|nr:hypothetical protein [Candidatus Brocadiales bacterium]